MCLPTRTTVEANRLESHWEIYLILYFGRGVTLSDVYCGGVTISDTHRAGGAPSLSFLHFFFSFPTPNSHPSLSSSLPPPSFPLSGSLNVLWISKFLGSSLNNYPPCPSAYKKRIVNLKSNYTSLFTHLTLFWTVRGFVREISAELGAWDLQSNP